MTTGAAGVTQLEQIYEEPKERSRGTMDRRLSVTWGQKCVT
jgi:hypothetical protein